MVRESVMDDSLNGGWTRPVHCTQCNDGMIYLLHLFLPSVSMIKEEMQRMSVNK